MISENELDRLCPPRTLQRARQIAALGKNILTKQCRYHEDETTLSAFVASSSGWDDRYRTSVTFDDELDVIVDFSCTCPAATNYRGMCKHGAALLISYQNAPEKFLGYRAVREAQTSPCITEFMKRTEQLADEDAQGSIDIETVFAYGYHDWSAHFKVKSPNGSYVMKSISDFVERMRTGEHFSYGKKLAFTHAPAMLTERAQGIARFLERSVALRERTGKSALWRYSARNDVGRDLDLSESEVIELLDLQRDFTFTVEGRDAGKRRLTHAHIIEEDPRVDIILHKTERGGYAISRTDEVAFAAQGSRMYLWQDDVFYRCSPAFASCADFLRNVYESEDDRLFISERDMPLFCATALPAIENRLNIIAPAEIAAYRPVPCEIAFYFDKGDDDVTLFAAARYGDVVHSLIESKDEPEDLGPAPLRNERRESRARDAVAAYFGSNPRIVPDGENGMLACLDLANEQGVGELLFGGLAEFARVGEVFTTPAFDRLISDKKPRVTLGVSLAGNLINLDVSAGDLSPEELAALLGSYRRRKRFHRLTSGAYLDMADFNLAQLDKLSADLGISVKDLRKGTVELPSYRAFYLDQELSDSERDESFERCLASFEGIAHETREVPRDLAAPLRPYQIDGFHWLNALCDRGFAGILADEMGLGKSIQLISLLLARKDEARAIGPSLVVCPASLVYNWTAEFERFAPDLIVRAVAGSKRERARMRRDGSCDVLITSYDLLRIDVEDYADQTFFCCVLDEAQYIKNPSTLTTRSVKRIHARHRFALTGTPMENRLSELWSIFDFLMPGLLGSYQSFRERFELSIVGGDEDAARRLSSLASPFMLRRLKTDVLDDLPDKLESVVFTPLKGEQARLYEASEQKLRITLNEQKILNQRRGKTQTENKVEVLAELTKLRQLCCDPRLLFENYRGHGAKVKAIMDLTESAIDAGEKTLVFSQFTSFLALIAEDLDARAIPYYTITGATPKKKRVDLVDAFNGDDTPVFLVSLKAGGTGLNLTGASVVIHADPWWNAAAQNQATDRAHRIGQTKVVSVHRVIAKGTIEERILHLQEAKSNLADRIVGTENISLASLSKDDLIALLGD